MRVDVSHIVSGIAMGVGATLIMDGWNLFLKRRFGIQSLNYCLLGRWLSYMPHGTFRHRSITAAEKRPMECAIGWLAHYSIGMTLAVLFVVVFSGDWLARPTFLPVVTYGIVTVVFPFFVLQPALGLGVASSRTPHPTQARIKSLMTHTVFGIGLYVCALAMSFVLRDFI